MNLLVKVSGLLMLCLFASLSYAKITVVGTVTDGDGKPVSKCDVFFNKEKWIDDNSVHVQCDKHGRYRADIDPGLYNSLYICDETKYGKTALEFWGWNLNLTESQTIDAAFDTIEVFSLATWSSNGGSNSLFASFRPMQLKQPTYKNKMVNGKNIAVLDITPELDATTISAFVDEQKIELVSYYWTYEKNNNCNNYPDTIDTQAGCHMPMIIAQFKKPKLSQGQHRLKVRIRDKKTNEIGEGITDFVTNKSGFGF